MTAYPDETPYADEEDMADPHHAPYHITNTAEIGVALASIETRLQRTLTIGLTAVTKTINDALIQQAQLNATFATQSQLETLRAHMWQHDEAAATRTERIRTLEEKSNAYAGQIAALQQAQADRDRATVVQMLGWFVAAATTIAAVVLTFLLHGAPVH